MKRRPTPLFQLALLTPLAWVAAGCGSKDEWMPLKVGRSWTYHVRAGFDSHTVAVRVSSQVTVAATNGFELSGPLGVSRLAWKGGTLVAESTVNARFVPAIPLLDPNVELAKDKTKQITIWHGRVVTLGKEHSASAVLTEQLDTVDLGVRKVPTILATLVIRLPSGIIQLDSWYQSGVGLIQQEQRTNGTRIVQLTMIGHS